MTVSPEPVADPRDVQLAAALAEIDNLRKEVKRLTYLQRMHARHAQAAEVERVEAESRAATKDAVIHRMEAVRGRLQLELDDAKRQLYGVRPNDPAGLLRAAAEGRRVYAKAFSGESREHLEHEATTLDAAASVVEGNLSPLYSWLHSSQWTPEMLEGVGLDGDR